MVGSLMLALLHGYKRFVSPAMSPSCRFVPTCSDYAAEAIALHGAFIGSALALWRIIRCNPLNRGGLDLVPSNFVPRNFIHHRHQSQSGGCSHPEQAGTHWS